MSEPFTAMSITSVLRGTGQEMSITSVLDTVADRTGMDRGLIRDVLTPLTIQGTNTLQDAARLVTLSPNPQAPGVTPVPLPMPRTAKIAASQPFPNVFSENLQKSDPLPGLAHSLNNLTDGLANKGIILYQPNPAENAGEQGIILYQPKPGETIPDRGIILYQPKPGDDAGERGIILYQPKPEGTFDEGITLRPPKAGEGISDNGIILYLPKPGEGIILYQPKPDGSLSDKGIILYQPLPKMLDSSGIGDMNSALRRMGDMMTLLNEVHSLDQSLDMALILRDDI